MASLWFSVLLLCEECRRRESPMTRSPPRTGMFPKQYRTCLDAAWPLSPFVIHPDTHSCLSRRRRPRKLDRMTANLLRERAGVNSICARKSYARDTTMHFSFYSKRWAFGVGMNRRAGSCTKRGAGRKGMVHSRLLLEESGKPSKESPRPWWDTPPTSCLFLRILFP